MKWKWGAILGIFGLLMAGPGAWAAKGTVSVEEFQELKASYEQLKQEVEQLRKEVRRPTVTTAEGAEELATVEEVEELSEEVKSLRPGLTNFLLTGYGTASYTDRKRSDTNFTATFNPIFIWKLTERLLFEGELELELEEDETELDLEYAQITYLLNDFMTVGAGKFLSPFGIFRERLHPGWINKLPDAPLGYASDANLIVPKAQIGAQVRGGFPLWEWIKANYSAWISNGPALKTEEEEAGELSFKNTDDNNNNKAFGFRVGLLPLPELEMGYSLQVARVGENGEDSSEVDSLLQGMDVSYVKDCEILKGAVDARFEWLWSDVDRFDFETEGGPFANNRDAGYAQLAYRPKWGGPFIEKLEPLVRFDLIDQPNRAPNNEDQERWTFGLNYWFTSSTVLKAAYQIDERRNAKDEDAFLIEAAMGF